MSFGHIFLLFLTLIDLKSISYNIVLHVLGTSTSILPANFSFVEPSTCIPDAVIEVARVPLKMLSWIRGLVCLTVILWTHLFPYAFICQDLLCQILTTLSLKFKIIEITNFMEIYEMCRAKFILINL